MHTKGFTLVEMIIVLIIIAVLITIAYPRYSEYVRKSRRVDATSTLLAMQLAQEKYRYNHTTYGNLAQVWKNNSTSPKAYYKLSISNNTATVYFLKATAELADQKKDKQGTTNCNELELRVNNGVTTLMPADCWG